MSGGDVDKFSLTNIFRKRIMLTASTLRARPNEYKTTLIQEFVREVYVNRIAYNNTHTHSILYI
jgi:hypothetical protein